MTMKRIVSLVVFFGITLVAVSFALLNVTEVELGYYLGSVKSPLSLVLVVTLAIGAGLGLLAALGVILRMKREIMRLQRSVKVAEKEVVNLRALPIKDQH